MPSAAYCAKYAIPRRWTVVRTLPAAISFFIGRRMGGRRSRVPERGDVDQVGKAGPREAAGIAMGAFQA